MNIGYARISTIDQNLDLQLYALKQAGCEEVFTDKITGTKFDRPQLNELKKILRQGDTVIVWKMDRIGFKSLTEGIDTTTNSGKLIFNIFASLAEFERSLIVERTQAGLRAGRVRGRIGGRPSKLTENQKQLVQKMHADKSIPLETIVDTFKISKQTIYNIINLK